ncbi:MAG TPA: Jag N-terminal domain-containing protein [Candidatus Omnitrophota bacterium]|nr:Jag N-terminal domain-containing protein [Candidatus Omnitrophota bacterium]HSA30363.1 Jag N-terminal domain-containing protein [Candidatus Omnitrophota bacterium]
MISERSTRKKWIFEGNTVEDAIQNGLKELGLSKEDVNIKVVNEEKRGLFGMEGADRAKIIITKK